MNKIININLAGRLIPIEENAYLSIEEYLSSLKSFFSKEEGGAEILHDMEDRIGELLQEKIKKGRPAINQYDITEIINIMGSPQQIIEETGDGANEGDKTEEDPVSGPDHEKRLARSEKEKVIGGVCGGLASYFNIDPAIVRILFAFVSLAWGTGILVYILLWIILPVAKEEPVKLKRRLYRNADQKIIAGVCSGIAAYLNIDPVWLRLIFSLPVITGVVFGMADSDFIPFSIGGIPSMTLLYIVLWAVLPKASTVAEKLEMRGKRIDVKNITDAVKQQEGHKEKGRSNIFVLLLKIFVIFIGGSILIAVCSALLTILFSIIYIGTPFSALHLILDSSLQRILLFVSAIFLTLIPLYAIIRLMVYLISGRKKADPKWLRFTLILLFVGSIFSLFWIVGSIAGDFKTRYYKKEMLHLSPVTSDTLFLSQGSKTQQNEGVEEIWGKGDLEFYFINRQFAVRNISMNIVKSPDSMFHLEVEKSAYGKTADKAKSLTLPLTFDFEQDGNRLYLPRELRVPANQLFRGQHMIVTVMVPEGKYFYLDGMGGSFRTKKHFRYGRGRFDVKKAGKYHYDGGELYRMGGSGEGIEVDED